MQILFNNEPFESQHYGGVNKFFGLLLNELQKTETVLQPYYIRNPFIDKNKFLSSIIYQNEIYYRYDKKLKFLTFLTQKFFTKKIFSHLIDRNKRILLRRIYKNNFDILHVDFCESPSNKIVDRIIKHVTKPIILTVHDIMTPNAWPSNENYLSQINFAKSKTKLLAAAAKIVTVSNTTKQDLINFFNIAENKISIVHCCHQKQAPQPCAAKLPEKYILYIGKRTGHKNFRFLADSIKDILLADNEIKLIFTLHDFDEEERAYFENLKILNSCIHFDARNEQTLAYLYENALCCVVPSLYEGFGMIALEAMNYGCPVVASDIKAAIEVAGDAALYFDPLDQKSAFDAVKKVIYDNNLRAKMAEKGYERAKIFTVENSVASLREVYREALGLK